MSHVARAMDRLERFGDKCNAILVKEVRQALKSRQFVATFMLLLIASWAGAVFGVAYEGEAIEYGSPAGTFFGGFFFALCLASLVIVPFSTFRSIVEERSENTLELLQITTLAPRQIVWGKLLSALVQVLVYYSAIAPFIAFTSMLQGFNVVAVTASLIMLLFVALFFSMIALTIGAATRQKAAQAVLSLLVGGAAFGGMSGYFGIAMNVFERLDLRESETWWGISFVLIALLSFTYLCQQIAVAHLTFESDNRSSGIRATVFGQWVLLWGSVLLYRHYHPTFLSKEATAFFLTVSAAYMGVAGLFFTTESDQFSRRVRRGFPRFRVLRFLWAPFLPGGSRGYCFAVVTVCVPFLAVASWVEWHETWTGLKNFTDIEIPLTVSLYVLIYMGITTWLSRSLRRAWRGTRTGHVILMTALIFAAGVIIPYLPRVFQRYYSYDYTLSDALNPALVLSAIGSRRYDMSLTYYVLGGAALLMALVNVRAVIAGILDVVESPLPRISDQPAAPALGQPLPASDRVDSSAALAESATP